jgi:putative FmdB family regulatory protein
MPTYVYRCEQCGQSFERLEHVAEHESVHRCPNCGSERIVHVMAEFYAQTPKKT